LSRASPLPPSVLPAREQVTRQVDPAVLALVRVWVLRPPPVSSLLDSICFGVQILAPVDLTRSPLFVRFLLNSVRFSFYTVDSSPSFNLAAEFFVSA
jgi:hypothetical protein